jgi:hypothetical protein
MRAALAITLVSIGMAALVSCAGQVTQPDMGPGAGGALIGASGGATGSGGNATGGDNSIDPTPMSMLTDDCVLAEGTTEYTRSRAVWQCFSVASFSEADASQTFPTFPAGGMGGLGGAASTSCPAASELDWSCSGGEGRCCPSPQCEAPEVTTPVDGQCCYVVWRSCGV